jgi:hypothetical protein
MSSETPTSRSLCDFELEVEAEGREWMRRPLEEKPQAEADALDPGVAFGMDFEPEALERVTPLPPKHCAKKQQRRENCQKNSPRHFGQP